MNRQEKEQVVQDLRQSFQESSASFLVGCRGLSVEQLQNLRKDLRKQKGSFQVAKVRLMKLAVHGIPGAQELDPFFRDQLGVVFATDDSPAVAKILYDFSKENAALTLVAGCLDETLISKDAISTIATLPSRQQLLAMVCGTLNAPISGFVNVLNMLVVRFLYVLQQIEKQKNG